MGLDTSHNAWQGGYSRFGDWRRWLAKQIGMNLNDMEGFGGDRKFSDFDHPVLPLLNHSDCDGKLTTEECKRVAWGLDEIIHKAEQRGSPEQYEIDKAKQFREGCLLAIENGEEIEFQ